MADTYAWLVLTLTWLLLLLIGVAGGDLSRRRQPADENRLGPVIRHPGAR